MDVGNAIVVVFSEERSHRDDIFRIVVFDEAQVSEFTFSGGIVSYDVGGLYVDALTSGFGANKVDFASLQLSNIYLIAKTDKMLVDDVLYHFLDVTLPSSASNGIAYAVVFEVKLVVGLEDSLSVNVVSVHLVQDVGFAEEGDVIGYHSRSYGFSL